MFWNLFNGRKNGFLNFSKWKIFSLKVCHVLKMCSKYFQIHMSQTQMPRSCRPGIPEGWALRKKGEALKNTIRKLEARESWCYWFEEDIYLESGEIWTSCQGLGGPGQAVLQTWQAFSVFYKSEGLNTSQDLVTGQVTSIVGCVATRLRLVCATPSPWWSSSWPLVEWGIWRWWRG